MAAKRPPNPNTRLILERYCEIVGNEFVYQAPKMMAAAKNLANYGLEPENLAPLLDWTRTTWAGQEGTDLIVGQMMYWKWIDKGRPGAVVLNMSQSDRIRAIRESTDPKYLGSAGARLREREIEALMEDRDEGSVDVSMVRS